MTVDETLADLTRARLAARALVYEQLARDATDSVVEAAQCIAHCFTAGGKAMFFGNGGSAAEAQHIAAEFSGGFGGTRPLPALALTADTSVLTAVSNDFGFERVFARQIEALAAPGDVVIALSTSGRSPNILAGVAAAQAAGAITVGLAGPDSPLTELVEVAIVVPLRETFQIQEAHLTIGHTIHELVLDLLGANDGG